MNLYLVIPDAYDGGPDCELVVRALDPAGACRAARTHLRADEITEFQVLRSCDDQPGVDVWMTREFPNVEAKFGVLDWKTFKATYLKPIKRGAWT